MKKTIFTLIVGLATINFVLCAVHSNAQYTRLLDFAGTTNGSTPYSDLFFDGTYLYGTTSVGGANSKGVVFKIKPDGTGYADLLDFAGTSNGSSPLGALISDGTFLYGMTKTGGANNYGTIFKVKKDGTGYVDMLDFVFASSGSNPEGGLFSDGTYLYGMTWSGGTNTDGTIFKIKPDGTGYTKLLDFAGATNGKNPMGSFVSDGTFLYGTTTAGGTNDLGIVFAIKKDGTGFTKLIDFAGMSNGSIPQGSLLYDGINLFGMTTFGGASSSGTVFKVKPDGTGYAKLLDFTGFTNGSNPWGGVIQEGLYLYGMTRNGGLNGDGTLFEIKPDGTGYADLYDFDMTSGIFPQGSLTYDGSFFYGMTYNGGANNFGTIFKFGAPAASGVAQMTANAPQIAIYPNPAKGKFTIERKDGALTNCKVTIYNTTGQQLFSTAISDAQRSTEIDLTGSPKGIFFVKIQDETTQYMHKIVME